MRIFRGLTAASVIVVAVMTPDLIETHKVSIPTLIGVAAGVIPTVVYFARQFQKILDSNAELREVVNNLPCRIGVCLKGPDPETLAKAIAKEVAEQLKHHHKS